MSMSAIAARAAALLLTSEKGRKGVGFLLVAVFTPVILIAAILCSATCRMNLERTLQICRPLSLFWIRRWRKPTPP